MVVLMGIAVRTFPDFLRAARAARRVGPLRQRLHEATLTGIAAQVQSEHDELACSTHAERLEVVGLIRWRPYQPRTGRSEIGLTR